MTLRCFTEKMTCLAFDECNYIRLYLGTTQNASTLSTVDICRRLIAASADVHSNNPVLVHQPNLLLQPCVAGGRKLVFLMGHLYVLVQCMVTLASSRRADSEVLVNLIELFIKHGVDVLERRTNSPHYAQKQLPLHERREQGLMKGDPHPTQQHTSQCTSSFSLQELAYPYSWQQSNLSDTRHCWTLVRLNSAYG